MLNFTVVVDKELLCYEARFSIYVWDATTSQESIGCSYLVHTPHVQFEWFHKSTHFVHHNQFFDGIIISSDGNMKELIVMQKVREPLEALLTGYVDRTSVTSFV